MNSAILAWCQYNHSKPDTRMQHATEYSTTIIIINMVSDVGLMDGQSSVRMTVVSTKANTPVRSSHPSRQVQSIGQVWLPSKFS